MLVLPSVVTYLTVLVGCHLVYLRKCSEACAVADRINAAADVLRHDPRWEWRLIDPSDLTSAGMISQADANRVIVGEFHFARFLAPNGGPYVVWTCDDSMGHHEYPDVNAMAAPGTRSMSHD